MTNKIILLIFLLFALAASRPAKYLREDLVRAVSATIITIPKESGIRH